MKKTIEQTFLNRDWRLDNLYSIVDKQAKRITFKRNAIQKSISDCSNKRKMILKARQFGVSTGCLIEQFDYTITNRNVTSVILAHEQDSIKKLFRIPRRAYNYLDNSFKPVLDRGGGSKHELYFPLLNSRIYCDLESRGDTIHNLHISEMAFIKEPERVLATLQAVPLDGVVTIETTANGMGNLYYDMWTDAEQPYAKLFFPWFMFPEYRIGVESLELRDEELEFKAKILKNFSIDLTDQQFAYRRYKQKELGKLFLQEYPEDDQTCFLSSGGAAIDLFKVKAMQDSHRPVLREDGNIKIYTEYDRRRKYAVGVDCAEGVEGDSSVAVVFDAHTREQVACLRSASLKPYQFAEEIHRLCRLYWTEGRLWPLLAVERNNHGHAVLLELNHHIQYPNLFHREIDAFEHKYDDQPGWVTDKITRPLMIDTFIEGLENNSLKLNDLTTLQECLTLVNEEGKIQAATGKHDDCIIACAIAIQMCIECASLSVYDDMQASIRI